MTQQQDIDFTPPESTAARWRRRRNRLIRDVLVVAGVALLGVGGYFTVPGLFSGCGNGTANVGGECIGVTDDPSTFPGFQEVLGKIKKENERVQGSENVVTVPVFAPVSHTDEQHGAASHAQVRALFEGAYVAQLKANEEEDANPMVRVVVANPGSRTQEPHRVAGQLADMAGDQEHPVVAVTGMGVSVDGTVQAARDLSGQEIPMVGSVITANGLNKQGEELPKHLRGPIQGLVRVSPSNRAQIEALAEHLLPDTTSAKAMLVRDTNPNDFYTQDLEEDFRKRFALMLDPETPELPYDGTAAGTANSFTNLASRLCDQNAPETVLYAGRAQDLPGFISKLGDLKCKNFRVVTGSDAASLHRSSVPSNVEVVYVALAAPEALRDPVVNGPAAQRYREFEADFTEGFPDPAKLDNGWAIMSYDAMLAATTAIQNAVGQTREPPALASVREKLDQFDFNGAIPGAGGPISFDSRTGDPIDRPIDVMMLHPNGHVEHKKR